ncbi:MAG: ice-binding family protein [Pseudolabrys sp.]|nr:ice-binding family protein [Pseudolabrys sp.]MDP2294451.1 ice-binding family protein [Pseudolabrys sp.]
MMKLALARSAFALGVAFFAMGSPSSAQAPALGTVASFGVLGASTVTNTGTSIISGNLGVSPGNAIVGFPPGVVVPPGTIHAGDATALQAQNDLATAYAALAGTPATSDLTGQNLGGLVLIPGVYSFSAAAQLTGLLTLNGLNNPNSVFIFNIGSSLTTASASVVSLINGAQGGNVFWRVGSSATLGTTTAFTGDILAQASITLNTGANITCGAAWALTGAVTLDTNMISLCALLIAGAGPGGATLVSLLPASASQNQIAVATAIDTFFANGGILPTAFLDLFNLSPADLANALSQLNGEVGTGAAQAGTQSMNSFLSVLTNPFNNNGRSAAPEMPTPPRPRLYTKAPAYKAAQGAAVPEQRRWSVWAAAYGSSTTTGGDAFIGSHDRSVRTTGYAAGLDYRLTPYTVVGFALAGGNATFDVAGGYGSGRSDLFQAALYTTTRINAVYLSTALAFAWHQVSTNRSVTVAGTDTFSAEYSATNFAGRIEGGYRFSVFEGYRVGFGVTPYAAAQLQIFNAPSYRETVVSGSPVFALAYEARTTTTVRTELGLWFDKSYAINRGSALTLFARTAWAHDTFSDPSVVASFQSLPGSSFTVTGAEPVSDSLLLTAGAELSMKNGWAVMAKLDGELAQRSQTYTGTARLRYAW